MIFPITNKPPLDDGPVRPELIVPWWKILAVIACMLGPGALFGAGYGLTHPPEAFYLLFSDRFFLINGIFQSVMLAGLLIFLHRRGWKPSDFRIRIGFITSLRGLELLVFTYGGFLALTEISRAFIWLLNPTPEGWIAKLFVPHQLLIPKDGLHLHWLILIVFTVLNAFYEEIVYMGYGFNLWATKYGLRAAVLFTVFLRLVVHTYQGTEHILPIAVWATIFGIWYRYHRAVWPLVLAHLMIDLISIGLLKILYGAH
jgi:membrane protease YdiL (CAAX protease family)